jgi:DNA-directed RNA polymerase subunit H (RpoH/RPB5)
MEHNGFETSAYSHIGQNEIEMQLKNGAHMLDLILTDPKVGKKIYIQFAVKMPNRQTIISKAEDLFDGEAAFNIQTDTLFIIVCNNDTVSDTQHAMLSSIWLDYGMFIVMEHISHLQFNKLKMQIVPHHHIMTPDEIENDIHFARFRSEIENLSTISRFDPIARLICARPDQIIHIVRSSDTAITSNYWRRVVN